MRINYNALLTELLELGDQWVSEAAGYTVAVEIRAVPKKELPKHSAAVVWTCHWPEQVFLGDIVYDEALSSRDRLFALAHELGHAIDLLGAEPALAKEFLFAYVAKKKSRTCAGILFEVEKRAWVHAELLLKEIRVPECVIKTLRLHQRRALLVHLTVWRKQYGPPVES